MLNNQIALSVLLLFISVLYLFVISSKPQKYTRIILRLDVVVICGLTLLYSIFNFIHYASFDQYQDTAKLDQNNQSITLVLNNPRPLKAFYYSTSYIKGQYRIEAFNKNGQKLNIEDKDSKLGYAPYFRWNAIDLSSESAVNTISFTLTDGLLNLSKVALVNKNNRVINDYRIISNFNASADALDALKSNFAPSTDDNYTTSTVFDEIYYATSAYQYLHNTSPDVWVHPQLGILLTCLGILVFGVSTFGFRIMISIATIAMLPIMFTFAKRVFKSTKIAALATILFMVEFMNFVLGRFASLEPFVTLFLFLEYYFLYCYLAARAGGISYRGSSRSLLYAGICFGLAVSSKWNALYSSLMIIFVIIYAELISNKPTVCKTRKKQNISLNKKMDSSLPSARWNDRLSVLKKNNIKIFNLMLQFVVVPLLIYTLVYIPYAHINNFENLWQRVYQLQGWMLNFNMGLTNATHPYASNFWSWPLDIKPLSVYYWQQLPRASSVAVMGNPLIFWAFFPVIVYLLYVVFKDKRNYTALFLLLGMLVQYLPYALIHRISFIYYFYSVTPLLILGICYVLKQLLNSSKRCWHIIAYSYVAIAVILFLLFYPLLSGVEFSRDYVVHYLLWLPTWNI